MTLTQISATEVGVDVKLASSYYFANTGNGNGATFNFNLLSAYRAATIDYTGTAFSVGAYGAYTDHGQTFTNYLDLTSHGTSGKVSTLDFDVTLASGIGIDAFADAAQATKYAFGIDLGQPGKTGTVSFDGLPASVVTPQTPPAQGGDKGTSGSVPEPTSLALIGLGLLGIAALRKRDSV